MVEQNLNNKINPSNLDSLFKISPLQGLVITILLLVTRLENMCFKLL